MRKTAVLLALALAVGIVSGMLASESLNAQDTQVKRTPLVKTDLAGMPGREANITVIEFAPGAASGTHYHPTDAFVYVLEGSVTLEETGKAPVTYKAGQLFHELPKVVGNAKNASTTEPVKVLVFQVTEKGQPSLVPVK